MHEVRQAFGRRLRALRLERGWSQEALAERANLHWTYVGGIERGERNPALENINHLARALGIPLAVFFAPFTAPLSSTVRRRLGRARR